MRLLSRYIFREIVSSALLGVALFTFVLFLQKADRLFEQMVRASMTVTNVGYLFLLVLPPALPFTIPLGVLVGTLIGLSRMSSDNEIVAMRAGGIPSRAVIAPVLAFGLLATLVAGAASTWLTPLSVRETYRVINRMLAAQLTAEIQPRVFQEQFPNMVLYVGDVIAGTQVRWRNVFMADLTPPGERPGGGHEDKSDLPRITVAREAVAVPDAPNNRIQLSLRDSNTVEVGRDPVNYFKTGSPRGDQILQAAAPMQVTAKKYVEMDMGPLWRETGESVEAAIEFHQRLALPMACFLLAVLAIPLGVSTRKAGKAAAFVVTVALAFVYYMGLITLNGLARQGTLPAALAVWLPNIVFGLTGLVLLLRLERPGERDWAVVLKRAGNFIGENAQRVLPNFPAIQRTGERLMRIPLIPQVVDTYVLSLFLFYLVVLAGAFVLLTQVFTFFELLGDIVRNQVAMSRVFTYLFFLTPKLIYDVTPVSVLVAVLITFGVLSKNNEVTAFKACGVSLHRLALPVLLSSAGLSLFLFAFDHYYVPEANRVQDALRAEIKGSPVQTYLDPGRKWVRGSGSQIYYYKYFDPVENVMSGVNVYVIDPKTFDLRRHIYAERARWEPSLRTWIFQNGWWRDVDELRDTRFETFEATTFSRDVTERPSYFLKEVKQDKQMNFQELQQYIADLKQSGFDTVRLQVQFYRKFSVPLFAFIMALISVPFAFLAGNRGAMAGVGISLGIAVAYWSMNQLFEQIGNVNQLPPALAAWSPDVLFTLSGMYLMARLRT
jgi:LPS export ABC transporter permease LptG/LPS export ABC transporter permease LptF